MGAAGGNRKSVLPSRRGGTASDCKTQPRMRCYLPTGVVSRKGQAYDGKQRAALCSAHPCFFRRVGTTRSLLSALGANARPIVRAGIRSGNLCRWGRPSIDPVVFFKLQLVMFFEGIRSERQLIATASLNLAHRWYLGFALNEDLP